MSERARLLRALGRFAQDVADALEAMNERPPDYEGALLALHSAEISLRDCRRRLEHLRLEAAQQVKRDSEPPNGGDVK